MKSSLLLCILSCILMYATPVAAQFISDVPRAGDWTGTITKSDRDQKMLFGKIGFNMSHSYEMNFTTFAGQSYNQNMYTNTMFFQMSNRLNARMDISLAHSPFGNGLMTQGNDVKLLIRNAELNYRLGEKSTVSVSFSQMPYGYGYGGMYDTYGMRNSNRFRTGPMGSSGNPFFPY